MHKLIKIGTIALWLTGNSLAYAYPLAMTYSGRVTDESGKPIEGKVDLQVKFFRSLNANLPIDLQEQSDKVNAETDTIIFSEVPLNLGVFSLTIELAASDLQRVFSGEEDVYIELTDLTNRPTSPYPRQKYSMIPFAFKIPVDDDTISFNEEGKLTVNNFLQINTKAEKHAQDIQQNKSKSDLITVTEQINIDTLKSSVAANSLKNDYPTSDQQKVSRLSVTQAVDLDEMKIKFEHLDVSRDLNLDHITVTSAIDLDGIATKVAANKAKTDLMTVSGSSVDLNDIASKVTANKAKTDLMTVSGSSVDLNDTATKASANKTKTDLMSVSGSSVNLNSLASDIAASKAKTDNITVSGSSVNLNTMASNISTNATNIAANAISTTSLTQANSLFFAGDEVRGRDTGGLKLNQKDGTAGLQVGDTGMVGLRNPSPVASLDIADPSDATAASLRVRNGLRDDWLELTGPAGSLYSATISGNYYGENTTHNFIDFVLDTVDSSTAGNLLLQKDGGKVGIGTETPNAELELSADSGSGGVTGLRIVQQYGTDSVWEMRAGDNNGSVSNYFEIYGGEAGAMSSRLLISSSGNVGIGTTAPKSILDIQKVKLGERVSSAEDRNNSLLVYKKQSGFVAKLNLADADALNDATVTVASFNYNLAADGVEGERVFVKVLDSDSESSVGVRINEAARHGSLTYNNTGYTMNDGSLVARLIDITDDLIDGTNTARMYATSSDGFGVYDFYVFTSSSYWQMGEPVHKEQLLWKNMVANSKVGVGNLSPSYALDVTGDMNTTTCYKAAGTTVVGGTCSSDERFKRNIQDLPNMLELFKKLRVVGYQWRSDEFPDRGFGKETAIGVIAQEVKEIFPELVTEDDEGYLKVDFTKLNWYLTKAVVELANDQDRGKLVMLEKLKVQDKQISKIYQNSRASDQKIAQMTNKLSGITSYLCAKDKNAKFCNK